MPTRPDDAAVKVGFSDDKWFLVPGSGAIAEEGDGVIYLAIPVRNVGSGIAVLHGWHFHADPALGATEHPPVEEFRRLTRDLYIASGELGFWQGVVGECWPISLVRSLGPAPTVVV